MGLNAFNHPWDFQVSYHVPSALVPLVLSKLLTATNKYYILIFKIYIYFQLHSSYKIKFTVLMARAMSGIGVCILLVHADHIIFTKGLMGLISSFGMFSSGGVCFLLLTWFSY